MHDYRYRVIGCYFSISVNEIKLQNKCPIDLHILCIFYEYFIFHNKKCKEKEMLVFDSIHI